MKRYEIEVIKTNINRFLNKKTIVSDFIVKSLLNIHDEFESKNIILYYKDYKEPLQLHLRKV